MKHLVFFSMLVFVLLASACGGAPDPYVAARGYDAIVTRTQQANDAQAAAAIATDTAHEKEFWFAVTQTAQPHVVRATEQAIALTDIALTRAWNDGTSTQAAKSTETIKFANAVATSIPATGTALAVHAQKDRAELESARSVNGLIAWAALGFIIGMGIGLYWLIGRARI